MTQIDINQIQKILPHRYPFLMIDRDIKTDPGKTLTAIKNVSVNEPFFEGHFSHHPVFPGVLMLTLALSDPGSSCPRFSFCDDALVVDHGSVASSERRSEHQVLPS